MSERCGQFADQRRPEPAAVTRRTAKPLRDVRRCRRWRLGQGRCRLWTVWWWRIGRWKLGRRRYTDGVSVWLRRGNRRHNWMVQQRNVKPERGACIISHDDFGRATWRLDWNRLRPESLAGRSEFIITGSCMEASYSNPSPTSAASREDAVCTACVRHWAMPSNCSLFILRFLK